MKGYFGGGCTVVTAGGVSATIDKVAFSTNTTIACTSASSQARGHLAGLGGSSTKGYSAGGNTGSSYGSVVTDMTVFSTDATAARVSVNLSQARLGVAGLSDVGL